MDDSPEQKEDNVRRRFQDFFDLRYVLNDGEWRIIKLLVFGLCGLILTAFVTGLATLVFK